jgi:hypothetical protein
MKEPRRPFSEEEDRNVTITHTFDKFHYWNLDKKPSADDRFSQMLDWMDLAKTVSCERNRLQRPVQQKRALAIVRMHLLLNYSEHCHSELSAREQSQVLTVLNRPQESRSLAMLSTDI